MNALNISVFGKKAAGRKTFAGLLYITQLDMSNTGEGDTFRFYASPNNLRAIQKIQQNLRIGKWPEPLEGVESITCKYTYFVKTGMFAKLLTKSEKNSVEISIRTYLTDMDDLMKSDINKYKSKLEADAFVLIIDATNITPPVASKIPSKDIGDYAHLVSDIAEINGNKTGLPIIFVFTKLDYVEKETFKSISIPEEVPQGNTERSDYGMKLLKHICPDVIPILKRESRVLAPPTFFFSSVSTRFNDKGEVMPRMKRIKGQVNFELDYSASEYEAFIHRLVNIINEAARKKK